MGNVQDEVKVSAFRQHLFDWLDRCREAPVYIVRGSERFELRRVPQRKPLGSPPPLAGLMGDSALDPEFSPAEWRGDDLP